MKDLAAIVAVVNNVWLEGHHFIVGCYTDPQGKQMQAYYVQDTYARRDAVTDLDGRGYGRKWHVSPHATDSEIVLTCLKAAITDAEHEVREGFEYKGRRIFQPHIDVGVLWDACLSSDARDIPLSANDRMRGDILG